LQERRRNNAAILKTDAARHHRTTMNIHQLSAAAAATLVPISHISINYRNSVTHQCSHGGVGHNHRIFFCFFSLSHSLQLKLLTAPVRRPTPAWDRGTQIVSRFHHNFVFYTPSYSSTLNACKMRQIWAMHSRFSPFFAKSTQKY